MLALIIYGYVYMFIAVAIIVIFPIILCVLRAKSDDEILNEENEERQDYVDNIIGGELLISYRKSRKATIMAKVSQSYNLGEDSHRQSLVQN